MRVSPLKHPLAVLRTTLGLGQSELAAKLGCSWRAIQSIELGTLKLSPKMANKICDETGVHFNWLMAGDPDAPIIDERGLPWRKEVYFDALNKATSRGVQGWVAMLPKAGIRSECRRPCTLLSGRFKRGRSWKRISDFIFGLADEQSLRSQRKLAIAEGRNGRETRIRGVT